MRREAEPELEVIGDPKELMLFLIVYDLALENSLA